MPRSYAPPSYRLHKARNCAVVTIHGKNHYLGPYGSASSREKYARLVLNWQPERSTPPETAPLVESIATVSGLILRYLDFASTYYVKHGEPTGELDNLRCALRPLKEMFGATPARDFGPKSLQAVRQAMINAGHARRTINSRIGRIKRAFRWATKEGLVPDSTYHALTTVEGLKRGRSMARETAPVSTVAKKDIDAILGLVSPHVRAMIQVQELAAMRPQDIRNLRTCDLEVSNDVWVYTPWTHKTDHHGHVRRIAIGPRAQVILKPFLQPDDPQAYVFSPRNARKMVQAERLRRKGSNNPRVKSRVLRSSRNNRFRNQYSKDTYYNAIARACKRANVSRWHPHQLRHNCATRIRREYGLDAASIVLGHRHGLTTEIYAEADFKKAINIMREIG